MNVSHPTRRMFLEAVTVSSYALLRSANRVTYRGTADRIEVLRHEGNRVWKIQQVPSANPSFVALDRVRSRLFAVNEIDEYDGLPAGSVESYSIAPASGLIELISRHPLSLSAIGPRHLAISPDGSHIVVAAYRGGVYNVLPVDARGYIGPLKQVLKEIGCGPHATEQRTAHPHSVLFHPSGEFLISTDLGCDRISVFAFRTGCLDRVQQIQTPAGSGPAEAHLDSGGTLLSVRHRLQPLLSSYRFNGRLSHPQHQTSDIVVLRSRARETIG